LLALSVDRERGALAAAAGDEPRASASLDVYELLL